MCEGNKKIMTTEAVRPVGDNQNLLTVELSKDFFAIRKDGLL